MSHPFSGPGVLGVVRVRASSLAGLFDDSLRWRAEQIDGIRGKTYGRSHLGSAVHFGTADFDRQRILPDGKPDAAAAVGKFVEYFENDAGVHWLDIEKPAARKIGQRLVSDYCTDISEQFEYVAVETPCQPLEITMDSGLVLQLTGTLDRIYTVGGEYGVMDFKSGYGIINEAGDVDVDAHGPQLAEYELLETMATRETSFPITLDAVVMGFSTRSGKIQWQPVKNPRSLLFGDGDNMGYLQAAAKIIEHGLWVGNPRSMLCTERYCSIYNNCFYRLGRAT